MRRHEWNLTPEQQRKLHRYLDDYPTLAALYYARQQLNRLLFAEESEKETSPAKACTADGPDRPVAAQPAAEAGKDSDVLARTERDDVACGPQ